MTQMIDVLMIGGCADGERRYVDPSLKTIEIEASDEFVTGNMVAPIEMMPMRPRYFYRIHNLHEGDQTYHVAVELGHRRPVIETLIDGYRPK